MFGGGRSLRVGFGSGIGHVAIIRRRISSRIYTIIYRNITLAFIISFHQVRDIDVADRGLSRHHVGV